MTVVDIDARVAAQLGNSSAQLVRGFIADGKTNRQIGDALHLAEKTVKNYVSSILSKLEVARRSGGAPGPP